MHNVGMHNELQGVLPQKTNTLKHQRTRNYLKIEYDAVVYYHCYWDKIQKHENEKNTGLNINNLNDNTTHRLLTVSDTSSFEATNTSSIEVINTSAENISDVQSI